MPTDKFRDVRAFICKWRAEKNLKMCAGHGNAVVSDSSNMGPLHDISQGELLFITILVVSVLVGLAMLTLRRRATREDAQLLDR